MSIPPPNNVGGGIGTRRGLGRTRFFHHEPARLGSMAQGVLLVGSFAHSLVFITMSMPVPIQITPLMAACCFSGPLVQSHGISCIKNHHDVIICIYIFTQKHIYIYIYKILHIYIHRHKYCFFDEQCIKALQK